MYYHYTIPAFILGSAIVPHFSAEGKGAEPPLFWYTVKV